MHDPARGRLISEAGRHPCSRPPLPLWLFPLPLASAYETMKRLLRSSSAQHSQRSRANVRDFLGRVACPCIELRVDPAASLPCVESDHVPGQHNGYSVTGFGEHACALLASFVCAKMRVSREPRRLRWVETRAEEEMKLHGRVQQDPSLTTNHNKRRGGGRSSFEICSESMRVGHFIPIRDRNILRRSLPMRRPSPSLPFSSQSITSELTFLLPVRVVQYKPYNGLGTNLN